MWRNCLLDSVRTTPTPHPPPLLLLETLVDFKCSLPCLYSQGGRDDPLPFCCFVFLFRFPPFYACGLSLHCGVKFHERLSELPLAPKTKDHPFDCRKWQRPILSQFWRTWVFSSESLQKKLGESILPCLFQTLDAAEFPVVTRLVDSPFYFCLDFQMTFSPLHLHFLCLLLGRAGISVCWFISIILAFKGLEAGGLL